MPVWLLYLLIAVAVHSATRFLVADKFPPVRVVRDWIRKVCDPRDENSARIRFDHAITRGVVAVLRSVAYLVTCEWCTSAYVGALIIWAATEVTSVPLPVLLWAATRATSGWAANLEGWAETWWKLQQVKFWQANEDLKKAHGVSFPEEE